MTRRQRIFWYVLVLVGALSLVRFGAMWFEPRVLPHNFTGAGHLGDVVLFAALTAVVWHRVLMDVFMWFVTRRVRPEGPSPEPPEGLRVAFITTFVPSSEPLSMLESTLLSLRDNDYPHDTWVLDEGNSWGARKLCERLGVHHFTRHGIGAWNAGEGKFAARTKGGNHNAWYAEHGDDYDVVAQIDTDFTARPDFLSKTLGHFRDPEVAFVGTPQVYGNAAESFVAKGAAQQTWAFYGPLLRAFSDRGMCLMLGANHVVRVAALKSVGFYEGHLTEDLATGMKLHSQGHKSVYVPEVLAVGEGPSTWVAYLNQQMRWAFGSMHILRHQTPTALKTMTWRQRVYYVWLQLNYLNGITLLLSSALLLTYFVFGFASADLHLVPLMWAYLPYLVWRQCFVLWLQRLNVQPDVERGPMIAARVLQLAAAPIYASACVGVALGRRISFVVTPKGQGAVGRTPLQAFRLHTLLAAVMLWGLWAGTALHHSSTAPTIWALVTGVLMSGFLVYELTRRGALVTRRALRRHHVLTLPEVVDHVIDVTDEAMALRRRRLATAVHLPVHRSVALTPQA